MPRYNYICNKCEKKARKQFGDDITQEQFEQHVLFETAHSMEPTEEELAEAAKCPRCNSRDCAITVYGSDVVSFIKGYGWADKDGARRDMNLFHLTQDDPYAQYRVPGEVDDMAAKLKRAGKHGSADKKHFVQNSTEIQKAVEKVTRSKPK